MQTILCPVDFSESSLNAVKYAISLAKTTISEIVLLHVFAIPVASADAFVFVPNNEEIKEIKDSVQLRLDEWVNSFRPSLPETLQLKSICRYGEISTEILLQAQELNNCLVIMGLKGEGFIKDQLIGSTSIDMINSYEGPILVIPSESLFEPVKRIAFFYDNQPFTDKHALDPLIQMTGLFNAEVAVCHISKEMIDFPSIQDYLCSDEISPSLNATQSVSFHIVQSDHFSGGVEEFLKSSSFQMIFMIKRKHSLLNSLFHKSHSKQLAYLTSLPLLSSLD